jgi:predicted Zn-dependent peptidase
MASPLLCQTDAAGSEARAAVADRSWCGPASSGFGLHAEGLIVGQLRNGMRYALLPLPHRTTVGVTVVVGAGSRHESEGEVGVAHLLEHLVFKGTRRYPTAQLLASAIEGVGGGMEGMTDKEATMFTLKVPAGEVGRAVDLAGELISAPLLRDEDLWQERLVVVDELAMYADSTLSSAYLEFDRAMWPTDPLGRPVGGDADAVSRISAAACRDWWERAYTGANLVVAVAGSISPGEIEELLDQRFSGIPTGSSLPSPPLVRGIQPRSRVLETDGEQAAVLLGGEVGGYLSSARPAAQLLSAVLGRGMASRWHQSLREDHALVYDIHSMLSQHRDTGALAGVASCDPKRLSEVVWRLEEELAQVACDGISEEELRRAIAYQRGWFLMGQEDTMAISASAAEQLALEGGIRSTEDEVAGWEETDATAVAAVAAELLSDGVRLTVAGPSDVVRSWEEAAA